jgi:hypothetical protein
MYAVTSGKAARTKSTALHFRAVAGRALTHGKYVLTLRITDKSGHTRTYAVGVRL